MDESGSLYRTDFQVCYSSSFPGDLAAHPRYELCECLGSGGMGTVYKARHRLMDRWVAVKIVRPGLVHRPAMVERFRREIRAAARLDHPNIVHAYDAEHVGATHFLVMELIDGVNLEQVLDNGAPLPVDQACQYAWQTALALQHAYERGMVHRDVKPHNLMLTPNGQIKVLDFGLARYASEVAPDIIVQDVGHPIMDIPPDALRAASGLTDDSHRSSSLAHSYAALGTADYMAPEICVHARSADIRADLYSLGCTLYRLLTGSVPFPQETLAAKLRAHQQQAPPSLARARAEVPPRLEEVVQRLMAKDPSARFATPLEAADALTPFITPRPGHVLVVEDDVDSREAMAQALETQGHTVTRAASGSEALQLLTTNLRPDLILLDLRLPGISGLEFLEIRRQNPALDAIPVVVVSAANQAQARALALGAADFLQKPVAMDQLAGRVGHYVSGN